MANDKFYGYNRKPNKVKGKVGVDLDFESVNPYEFKKGMYTELEKLGTTLRESDEDQREKATETVFKNLKDVPAYYSYMEHYETVTRNMDRKPSFKTFLKELEGHSMKEIGEKFTEDKMKEIKLKENIRAEVRNKINELFKGGKIEEGIFDKFKNKVKGALDPMYKVPKVDPTPEDVPKEPKFPNYIFMNVKKGTTFFQSALPVEEWMEIIKKDADWVETPSDFIDYLGYMGEGHKFAFVDNTFGKDLVNAFKIMPRAGLGYNLSRLGADPEKVEELILSKAITPKQIKSGKPIPRLTIGSLNKIGAALPAKFKTNPQAPQYLDPSR